MFRVFFPRKIRIQDCPKNGLPAVDFRRKAGLPEEPSHEIDVVSVGLVEHCDVAYLTDEATCRRFADELDSNSDLRLDYLQNWREDRYVTLPADVILGMARLEFVPLPDAIAAMMAAWARKAEADEAEKAEQEAAAAEKRRLLDAAQAESKARHERFAGIKSRVGAATLAESAGKEAYDRAKRLGLVTHEWEKEAVYYATLHRFTAAEQNLLVAAAAEAEAAGIPCSAHTLRLAGIQQAEAWLREHGSSRAKKLLAEYPDDDHTTLYVEERISSDWPGWVREIGLDGYGVRFDEPRLPPEEALDLLAEARADHPDIDPKKIKLRYVVAVAEPDESDDEDDDEDNEESDRKNGYIVRCQCDWLIPAIMVGQNSYLYWVDRVVVVDQDREVSIEDWS